MKRNIIHTLLFAITILVGVSNLTSCIDASAKGAAADSSSEDSITHSNDQRTVSKQAKEYWFDGTAEISSYTLEQARYGETHKGNAVFVYVTEPFSKSSHTKADRSSPDNISVLKLNKTLNFNTGIYPYSMMNSSFFPVEKGDASLKLSSSVQEWCGMTYLEMKNSNSFVFDFDSYFEGQSFKNVKTKKGLLEDDLWSLIRLNPESLPTGSQKIIPSMFFLRLKFLKPKAYTVNASLEKDNQNVSHYTLTYPDLARELTIHFNTDFPHEILGWEDTHTSGYGSSKKVLTSKAELNKSLKTDYWNQNRNKDLEWRTKLGL